MLCRSWGSGGTLSPPAGPGQSPAGGPSGKALEVLQFTFAKKLPKIHPCGPFAINYNFMKFVD